MPKKPTKQETIRQLARYLNLPVGVQRKVKIGKKEYQLRVGEIRPPRKRKSILGVVGAELRRKF